MEQTGKEEELKNRIYQNFLDIPVDPSLDNKKPAYKFADSIFRWCSGYQFKWKANRIGKEILELAEHFAEKKLYILEETKTKEYFFGYLTNSIKFKIAESYREEPKLIEIPKEKKAKISLIHKTRETLRHNLEREPTNKELLSGTQVFMQDMTEKDFIELMRLYHMQYISSLEIESNDEENETDVLNNKETKKPSGGESYLDPHALVINKENAKIISNAVKKILYKNQDRTREEKRALFTGFCIDNNILFDELIPVLNADLLDAFHISEKKYAQYEISLMYKPNITKESAYTRACDMLGDFKAKLVSFLEKNNPEILLENS